MRKESANKVRARIIRNGHRENVRRVAFTKNSVAFVFSMFNALTAGLNDLILRFVYLVRGSYATSRWLLNGRTAYSVKCGI